MAADEKSEAQAVSSGIPSAGGGKIQLIITAVNLVVTLAMGGVLFLSFQREKHKPSVEDIVAHSPTEGGGEKAKEGTEAKGGEGHEGGEAKEGEAKKTSEFGKMITLDQFTVNLSTPGSVNPKFVRVNISLEVPNDDSENEVNQKMPQVRNTVIDLFNAKRSADLATPEGRDSLKEEIRKSVNDFLVTGKVKGVFFTNFALSG